MRQFFDILLDADDEPVIENGDLVIGESTAQEVSIILRLNQGELKSDPLLGPNLIRYMNGPLDLQEIQTAVKVHLARDNKSYDEVKEFISLNLK